VRVALIVAFFLTACGSAEPVSTTECRTTADNRQICTTTKPKELE